MNYNETKARYSNDFDFIDHINTLSQRELYSLYHSYTEELNRIKDPRETYLNGLYTQHEEEKELKRFIPYFQKAIKVYTSNPFSIKVNFNSLC